MYYLSVCPFRPVLFCCAVLCSHDNSKVPTDVDDFDESFWVDSI